MPTLRISSENQNALHFVTLTTIEWIDLFTKSEYFLVIKNSLNYCIEQKGLLVYEYVIMSNHIHLIVTARQNSSLSEILRDFKRHTTKEVLELVRIDNRRYLKNLFRNSYFRKKGTEDQIWQRENYPECIETEEFYLTKQKYIHNNPVKKLFVDRPEDWLYSSASTKIAGKNNLVQLESISGL